MQVRPDHFLQPKTDPGYTIMYIECMMYKVHPDHL